MDRLSFPSLNFGSLTTSRSSVPAEKPKQVARPKSAAKAPVVMKSPAKPAAPRGGKTTVVSGKSPRQPSPPSDDDASDDDDDTSSSDPSDSESEADIKPARRGRKEAIEAAYAAAIAKVKNPDLYDGLQCDLPGCPGYAYREYKVQSEAKRPTRYSVILCKTCGRNPQENVKNALKKRRDESVQRKAAAAAKKAKKADTA